MKVQLKEITPYLPYLVKCKTELGEERTVSTETSIFGTMSVYDIACGKGKLYLKRLSSKELECITNNNTYWNHLFKVSRGLENASWSDICTNIENNNTLSLPYAILDKLFQWHYDVFGLIDKGMAIEYNS